MKNIIAFFLLISIASCAGKKTIEGDQYYDKGEYSLALESYDKFLTVYPRNIKTLYNRARTQEKLGHIELAIKDLKTLLELEPDHLQARITLGEMEFNLGDYNQALYEFDQAVNSHKQSSVAYAYRAKANQKLGKLKKADSDYGVAIRLDSKNGMAYLYRGTLYLYQKKNTSACNDFKQARDLGVLEAESAIKKYCKG